MLRGLESVGAEANCDSPDRATTVATSYGRAAGVALGEDSTSGAVSSPAWPIFVEVNQSLGRNATDDLLRAFGEAIAGVSGASQQRRRHG